MRKHEFRGKKWNHRWAYGSLWDRGEKGVEIVTAKESGASFVPVLAQTVGEYTGFLDVNKLPVYEGDLLNIPYDFGNGERGTETYEVFWSQDDGGWMILEHDGRLAIFDKDAAADATVVGNIWDNPDWRHADESKQ